MVGMALWVEYARAEAKEKFQQVLRETEFVSTASLLRVLRSPGG